MDEEIIEFINRNVPDGGFLASEAWREFQAASGQRTCSIRRAGFLANGIESRLSLVGSYLYVPRGPVFEMKGSDLKAGMDELIRSAQETGAAWIRIEPVSGQALEAVKKEVPFPIRRAPHDMQPKEVLVMDISSPEDKLLSAMKSKTRYNIRLAEKKGVRIFVSDKDSKGAKEKLEDFIRLVGVTARRDGIVSHPAGHYRKMLETLPAENLKLYAAGFEGNIVAANLVIFFGDTATYLHGASDDAHRNVMAPYLLQWEQIRDAKKSGCSRYDFGGVKSEGKGWAGITRFKTGFAPGTEPTVFPGSYDIVLDKGRYRTYLILSKAFGLLSKIRK